MACDDDGDGDGDDDNDADGTICVGQSCWAGSEHAIFAVCDALLSLTMNRFDCGMDVNVR